MQFIQRLRIDGLLSFPPGSEACGFQSLNVLIGPNGSGKTNVIEVLELLHALPLDFAAAIRSGGGAAQWLWKGSQPPPPACIEVETAGRNTPTQRPLRYKLEFTDVHRRVAVLDEAIEDIEPAPGRDEPFFHYRFQRGNPVIRAQVSRHSPASQRHLSRHDLRPDQSVLAQRRDPDFYPEIAWLDRQFRRIHTFREWSFGRYTPLRRPQPTDLPEDCLLPDNRNLALMLNQIEHQDPQCFNQWLRRVFPRFERMSTRVSGGTIQFFLHEAQFHTPVPAVRLADGILRFLALLVTLLSTSPPSFVCIEEPELGLHPDAVGVIAELLVAASERTQLLVTTHSDALVSALSHQPEAVIVCERPGAGTELRRLDPAQLAFHLNDYLLGDLWRMGELGANP